MKLFLNFCKAKPLITIKECWEMYCINILKDIFLLEITLEITFSGQ